MEHQEYKADDKIYLSSLDEHSKDNGIYKCSLKATGDPERKCSGPFIIYFQGVAPSDIYTAYESSIIKAKQTNVFICSKMGIGSFPNLYLTRDFKTLNPLTNFQPQKKFNWYTAELFDWDLPSRDLGRGMIFKPENFDPTKKYPLIVYFYERMSNSLNEFRMPTLSNPDLSISYYVSNGYIVLVTDNYYKVGHVADEITATISSAVRAISKKPWIDSLRIGVLGHSYGSYQVNCLITHTKLFKAAVSCNGISDLVSHNLSIQTDGQPLYVDTENGQIRTGGTVWINQKTFLDNSPILQVDKIITPTLILHNVDDVRVPWQQSLEMYLAMRRLNKPAWMLQYPNEGHFLMNEQNQLDFSIKLTEFFDHYLKNKPEPSWMKSSLN